MSDVKLNVPFYSQKWDLEKWREMGFTSRRQARYWEKSSCGVLCLKMAIDAFRGQADEDEKMPNIKPYIDLGLRMFAYNHITGWTHRGLVRMARRLGYRAKRQRHLSVADVCRIVSEGAIPIVSIRPAFDPKRTWYEKIFFWMGGHLALVVGCTDNGDPIVYHTDDTAEGNWKNRVIAQDVFAKGFTGRGIIVYLPEDK